MSLGSLKWLPFDNITIAHTWSYLKVLALDRECYGNWLNDLVFLVERNRLQQLGEASLLHLEQREVDVNLTPPRDYGIKEDFLQILLSVGNAQ